MVAPPAITINAAVALDSPVAAAVMVALPTAVGVNCEVATPLVGATGVAGLKEPAIPLTENVTASVAVITVFP